MIGGHDVVSCGRKRVLRREAVIDEQHLAARRDRDPCGERTMGQRRAADKSTAMNPDYDPPRLRVAGTDELTLRARVDPTPCNPFRLGRTGSNALPVASVLVDGGRGKRGGRVTRAYAIATSHLVGRHDARDQRAEDEERAWASQTHRISDPDASRTTSCRVRRAVPP